MSESKEFYRCNSCGNIVGMIKKGGGQLTCCNKPMELLQANSTDAATEKHVPIIERKEGKVLVKVGSVAHPMTPEHYIEWIAITNGTKTERISLTPTDKPEAIFNDIGNAEVYSYCNLHGLWKATV